MAKSGINQEEYWTRPKNDRASLTFFGRLAFSIAEIFSLLGDTPCLLRSCPKNVNLFIRNWHFFEFNVKPESAI